MTPRLRAITASNLRTNFILLQQPTSRDPSCRFSLVPPQIACFLTAHRLCLCIQLLVKYHTRLLTLVDLDDSDCRLVRATVPFQEAWSKALHGLKKAIWSLGQICEQHIKKEYFRQHPEKGIIQLNVPAQDPVQDQAQAAADNTRRHLNLQTFEVIQTKATHIKVSDVHKNSSALLFLPFYLIRLKYGKKSFNLLLNGLTRKIHGERPWSWGKVFLMALMLPFSIPFYYIYNMFFSYDYFPKKIDFSNACIQEIR